jgi:glycosyltransferase involved in cell wall biosynthesis
MRGQKTAIFIKGNLRQSLSRQAGLTVATPDLSKLTAIIRTFDRPQAIKRLVKSIRRFYPALKVLVADDGVDAVTCKQADCFRLPSEKGQAAAHNALLARVRTPYFLLIDDRAEVHRETQLQSLLELVASDRLDLAAGSLVACQRKFWFFTKRKPVSEHGLLEIAGDRLGLIAGSRSQGDGFWWCDFVSNFFVARTDRVRAMGGWDPELRDDAREEFFFRAHRHGIRVGIEPAASIWLWQEKAKPADVPQHDLLGLAVAKMGLNQMTDLTGRVIRAPRMARAA